MKIGFPAALTLIFIVLKLIHVINWSWWWVLSPSWICVILAIFFVILKIVLELKND